MPVQIDEPSIFHYAWSVNANMDVTFAITFIPKGANAEDEPVVLLPPQRIGGKQGYIEVEPGKVVASFDNSHSYFRSKAIIYAFHTVSKKLLQEKEREILVFEKRTQDLALLAEANTKLASLKESIPAIAREINDTEHHLQTIQANITDIDTQTAALQAELTELERSIAEQKAHEQEINKEIEFLNGFIHAQSEQHVQ